MGIQELLLIAVIAIVIAIAIAVGRAVAHRISDEKRKISGGIMVFVGVILVFIGISGLSTSIQMASGEAVLGNGIVFCIGVFVGSFGIAMLASQSRQVSS